MVREQDLVAAGEYFRALGHPSRLAILYALADGPSSVGALTASLGVNQPLVSQHLGVLHGAGLVCRRRHGREVHYALMDDHVAHMLRDALDHATDHPHSHQGEPHD